MYPEGSGVVLADDGVARCWWGDTDPLYRTYHDHEWGRPVRDDRLLFEKLSLEGFQAGLSWLTILRKREAFRRAFKGFDPEAVARFNRRSVERLMADPGIVRNRAKVEATVNNARRCLEVADEFGSLAAYVWRFEPGARPESLDWEGLIAAGVSAEATAMSKDLKTRGWSFVGPTIVHSFMEAMGLINDHLSGCRAGEQVERLRRTFRRPAVEAS